MKFDLNEAQAEAVRHPGGPLLVLAGAGSGKTRVLTYRIAHLIGESGVSPRAILAVTFTNKAADEMKRRVVELVGADASLVWIGTFHSVAARILRLEAKWGWWTASFSIYDEADSTALVKESMEKAGVSASVFTPKAVLSAISRAKDRLVDASLYAETAGGYFEECVAAVYREYEKGLRRMNAFDFDDLIMGTVRLLRDEPRVLEAYADRFEHVLVDEYQDTSHAQYELVNLLSSKHRNIMVVGDDDQSIYGWRGADISNILDFEHDHPDATVVALEQNYRSTAGILEAAHDVVSRNVRRKEKKLWTRRGDGVSVRLTRVANEYQEADAIRDTITALMDESGLAARDFAVLYRTHAQSRVIEDSLRRAGIAYDIIGGVRFYERAEVKDVLAYLRVVANPRDAVSLGRIINVPPRKLGARSLERVTGFAADEGISLREAIARPDDIEGLAPQARRSLEALAGMFDRLEKQLDSLPADALIREVLETSGYSAWLEGQRTDEAAERLANVEELVSAAAEFGEASERSDLPAFLEQVALVANIDMWEDRLDAVSLMTLHNAKGLEFKAVMIPGLEEGLLPHESSFGDDEELEEERRLLYVGMTRAKDHLVLLAADTRRRAGVLDVRAASRFLDDIAPGRLEVSSPGVRPAARPRRGRAPGIRRRPRADAFPDYENASQETVEIRPGALVHHKTWGEGRVLEVAGFGGDAIVRVRFAGDVEKRIMLRYGGLRPVESWED